MLGYLVKKIVGTKNEREVKRIASIVEEVSVCEPVVRELSDDRLRAKTAEYKAILAGLELDEQKEILGEILPEAFAVVREAACRTLGQRHFDAQVIGGIVLHEGNIAEMKTGEGKTLSATLPVYLNALTGRGVHVITVNDYLARRDANWMGEIYRFLGLSVGIIVHGLNDRERHRAYNSDITYGTNNEFGFDYLRDNMKFRKEDFVQRDLHYAIVDEVDSILIDEARTPLIISGPTEESTDKYYKINQIIPFLKREKDFTIEEKSKTVALTDEGIAKSEKHLNVGNLYEPAQIETLHHLNQALKAHTLFKRDVDYVVQENEVVIVDEFTGRLMPGRRYSDGLHQALEAKENVTIANENQTLASVTFQNYFRMYDKLSGMTGTADTEAAEFHKIYKLDVVVIPTNEPMIRTDFPDVIYKTEREKFRAVIKEIQECHESGQPVLVGTISIEKSETLAKMLKRQGIAHHVLNAKHHQKEAEIISQAGQMGSVTLSTNMAGRGTDIVLGEGVADIGGLHILGTERHESRRIDNQLRGRSGRQGDLGSSRFFLSLEDDLMRIFGSERIQGIMDRLGMEEDIPIEHNLVSRAIENAQRKVEGHNFDIRKHLLEYDDVMNKQREVIYDQRRKVIMEGDLKDEIQDMVADIVDELVPGFADDSVRPDEWDFHGLDEVLYKQFGFRLNPGPEDLAGLNSETLREKVLEACRALYKAKEIDFGEANLRHIERIVLLQTIDSLWKDHLLAMDHLKEGIGLRGYGQRNPLQEYQKEGYEMFTEVMGRIKEDTLERTFKIQPVRNRDEQMGPRRPVQQRLVMGRGGPARSKDKPQTMRRQGMKVGRNDPCPCGSGKKYKKCCGS